MAENSVGISSRLSCEQRLAQLAAERHPEAYAAELPESWAGHDVDMVYPVERSSFPVRSSAAV
jgi:hypothetical protein